MNITQTSEKTPFEKQPTQETFVQSATKPVQLQQYSAQELATLAADYPLGRGKSGNRPACVAYGNRPKCGGNWNGQNWCFTSSSGNYDICELYGEQGYPSGCRSECKSWRTQYWCHKTGGGWKWVDANECKQKKMRIQH